MTNHLQESLEQQLLAELMLDPKAWDLVSPLLCRVGRKAWTSPIRAAIFAGIDKAAEYGKEPDMMAVAEALSALGLLESVGGLSGLGEVYGYAISSAYVEQHARQLIDAYLIREMGAIGDRIRQAAERGASVDDLAPKAIIEIQDLLDSKTSGRISHIKEFAGPAIEAFERAQQCRGAATGIVTYLPVLDDLTGGFQAADYIILAARPSTGKTNVALSWVIAASKQVRVLMYSAEMTGLTLAQRGIGVLSNLNDRRIKRGSLAPGEVTKMVEAAGELSECEIYLNEAAAPDINDIEIEVRKLVREKKIGLVVIDYIGKVRTRRARSRQEEVAEVSARLKAIAKEHGIPVIALAQLNRNVESRSGLPVLSDLREAGDLEQDADTVIFLHSFHRAGVAQIPPGFEKYSGMPSAGLLCFVVAKQRTGPVGVVFARFVPETGRIMPTDIDVVNPARDGQGDEYRNAPDDLPF